MRRWTGEVPDGRGESGTMSSSSSENRSGSESGDSDLKGAGVPCPGVPNCKGREPPWTGASGDPAGRRSLSVRKLRPASLAASTFLAQASCCALFLARFTASRSLSACSAAFQSNRSPCPAWWLRWIGFDGALRGESVGLTDREGLLRRFVSAHLAAAFPSRCSACFERERSSPVRRWLGLFK